jgi:hypothetical protein
MGVAWLLTAEKRRSLSAVTILRLFRKIPIGSAHRLGLRFRFPMRHSLPLAGLLP